MNTQIAIWIYYDNRNALYETWNNMNKIIFHPGREIAIRIFDMRSTLSEFAESINIPFSTLYELSSEKRGITEDIATILSTAFNTTPEYWLEQQQAYDIYQREKSIES